MTLNSFLVLLSVNTVMVLTLIAIMQYDRAQREKEQKRDSDKKCP